MRKVVAAEFLSLDGVMESPDKWHFPYFNEEMGRAVGEGFASADAMLMGRVNYEESCTSSAPAVPRLTVTAVR
jgi:hypothetical protein